MDRNRKNGHDLIRVLWQTIKLRELENAYLMAIEFSPGTLVNCHLRRRVMGLRNYAGFLHSVAKFFEESIDWNSSPVGSRGVNTGNSSEKE